MCICKYIFHLLHNSLQFSIFFIVIGYYIIMNNYEKNIDRVDLIKQYRAHIINYHPITKEMIESITTMQPEDIKDFLILYNELIQNIIENIS